MAYSRWTNSKWYVFGASPAETPLDGEQLVVMPNDSVPMRFTYRELQGDLDACLRRIANESISTPQELAELKGYMQEYLAEVESEVA
jgi:hypothetical protein